VPVHVLDTVRGNTADTEHVHQTVRQIQRSAITASIHAFRKHHFPAQADVRSQLVGDAPCILPIPEEALLPLFRIGAAADVTVEAVDAAEHEGSQSYAVYRASARCADKAGVLAVKVRFTRPMAVA
jgi:hypothetical protein